MELGIDFGTTRTVVACADRGNFPVVSFVSPEGDALDWYPSICCERDGELAFGLDAMATIDDPSWTPVRSFKRLLADAAATPDQRVKIGGSWHALSGVLVGFLEALKRSLLTRSNLPSTVKKRSECSAVVATPANALGPQRFLTIDAFRRAGFDVTALLNEPSAAGFEYSHRYRSTLTSRREHVVVYDLGGGTFDASLVRMAGAAHDVLATGGRPDVGGDDFDVILARMVIERLGLDPDGLSRRRVNRLMDQCRDAKERLGPNSRRVVVDVEDLVDLAEGNPDPSIAFDVKLFYGACAPLVESTLAAMNPVMNRLERELAESDAEAKANGEPTHETLSEDALRKIAGIYVVGGASAFPAVGRALREKFGRRVHVSPYPSAAIAVGLAIAGDREAGYELTDRFSRYLGVFREARSGENITFDPIFREDAPLPRSGDGPTTLVRTYRAMHNVGHYRFVECETIDAAGGPQGRITPAVDVYFPFDRRLRARSGSELGGVDVERLEGDGPVVREEYRLDAHGLVELEMRDVETGYAKRYRLNAAHA